MPPRRNAPSTKAASVAVVVAPVAKAASVQANEATPKKLVDDLSEMPSTSKKRRLERRDTDDKSDRDIQRHFPHLIAQQVDSMTNAEDESLRGEINTAIRKLDPGCRLGANFWLDLQKEWAGAELSAVTKLQVKDPNEVVSKSLIVGLEHLDETNTKKLWSHSLLILEKQYL